MTTTAARTLAPFVIAALAGCSAPSRDSLPTPDTASRALAAGRTPDRQTGAPSTIPLLINGDPVEWGTLIPLLAEASGRDVVRELTLESALHQELRARGMTINDPAVQIERDRWTRLLGQDTSAEAERLIRRRRGLGPERFRRLLWRNAALRALIDPQAVEVSDEEVLLAVEIRRGVRYAASGVVLPDARTAIAVSDRARTDGRGVLAGLWSSALEHGVQPWHAVLSPHDPATPAALRRALTPASIGSPSGAIALDDGFGVVLVHGEVSPAPAGALADERSVRADLILRKERLAMERLAERLIARTPSHTLDRALSWDH